MYSLIDKSVVKLDSLLNSSKTISLDVISSPGLEILKPRVFVKFSGLGYNVKSKAENGAIKISYNIVNCKTEYSDLRKDGWFGSTILDRKISVNVSSIITFADGSIKPVEFTESITDIVKTDDIKMIEDASLTFTQSQIPQIPFFQNLLEPVIVVGALITTVILLFTIRGK